MINDQADMLILVLFYKQASQESRICHDPATINIASKTNFFLVFHEKLNMSLLLFRLSSDPSNCLTSSFGFQISLLVAFHVIFSMEKCSFSSA